MDVLIHGANILYLLSYLVRDILWLRVLTIVAILSLMPYYAINGLYVAVYWNGAFLLINLYQTYRLLLERRPVQLSLEQQRLYRLGFDKLSPRDFLRLISVGRWQSSDAGTVLIEQGRAPEQLVVIAEGQAEVAVDGRVVRTLGPGQFVGEMSFVSGQPPSASVVTAVGFRYLGWPRALLRKLLDERADLRAALQGIIGADLANKLRAGKEPTSAVATPPA